jgi:ubiquitin-conjugating enzyme E2 J2
MSDFHPESWNPMWTVSSILTGLLSFMLENKDTHGSVSTTDSQKRKFAAYSKTWNLKNNSAFRKHFPELIEESVSSINPPEPPEPIETPTQPPDNPTQTTQQQPQQTKEVKSTNWFPIVLAVIMFIAFINHWL